MSSKKRKQSEKSPFYVKPGSQSYYYDKPERFQIVRAHIRRDYLSSRQKLSVFEDTILNHAAALVVEVHQDLQSYAEGKRLPNDHFRKMQFLNSALDKLRPKVSSKRGASKPKDAGAFNLAEIVAAKE